MTVAAASEARPELVRLGVHVCAYLPVSGDSAYGLAKHDPASAITPDTCVMRADEGLLGILGERIAPAMYAGCDPATAARAVARLCPEPLAPMGARVELTPERHGSVPRAYVLCTRDRIVTPAAQRAMVDAGGPCPVVELDAGHSPMLECPGALAEVLVALAAG